MVEESGQASIIMDDREPISVKKWLENEGISVTVQRLDVGDYIITSEVIVERKSGTDFTSSIMDGRLFEQVIRLYDTCQSPMLVIENFASVFTASAMNTAAIYGAMAYLAYRFSLPIIPTRNWQDTALLVKRLAIRTQVKDGDPVMARSAPKLMTVDERKAFIIEGMYHAGPKIAVKLIDEFKSPLAVFEALRDTEVTFTKSGNPKGIEGPLKRVAGIGHKFVTENKKLLPLMDAM